MLSLAESLAEIAERQGVLLIFKASFDKANRSHQSSFRGPGLEQGLNQLEWIGRQTGLLLLTDVHEPDQCRLAAEVVHALQIPALLSRQTDLLLAAAETELPVNIKRGVSTDPRRLSFAVEKVGPQAWLTERGSGFGHGDLVFDPRSLVWMRSFGCPLLYDCTHSVQQPSGSAPSTGGAREMIQPLARAAAAVGVDGFYAEVHPEPSRARSDAAVQISPAEFELLVQDLKHLDQARRALC